MKSDTHKKSVFRTTNQNSTGCNTTHKLWLLKLCFLMLKPDSRKTLNIQPSDERSVLNTSQVSNVSTRRYLGLYPYIFDTYTHQIYYSSRQKLQKVSTTFFYLSFLKKFKSQSLPNRGHDSISIIEGRGISRKVEKPSPQHRHYMSTIFHRYLWFFLTISPQQKRIHRAQRQGL